MNTVAINQRAWKLQIHFEIKILKKTLKNNDTKDKMANE